MLSHDRYLVMIDYRLTSAPLPTCLHGHEAACGPCSDCRVEGDSHRYRIRQLETPVPLGMDDLLDVDAELRWRSAHISQLGRLLGREDGCLRETSRPTILRGMPEE